MTRPFGPRVIAGLLLLLLLAAPHAAPADTIHTRDGQRLKGEVLDETEAELTLKTGYGTLSIAKADIVRRERDARTFTLKDGSVVRGAVLRRTEEEVVLETAYGALAIPASQIERTDDEETAAAAARPPADPALLARLHQRASRLHVEKRYREAIAAYAELLELAPDDDIALYNTACAHALLGETRAAVSFLERSIRAGFADFDHIRKDTDLDSLREDAGYLGILADEARWVTRAAARETVKLRESLRQQGARGDYQVFHDEERNFIFLHTLSPERLTAVRQQLDEYARLQWRDLFRNRVREPLHIVLLAREDGDAILDPGVGGFFNPGTNVLICGDMPSMKLNKSNVVVHEFTHALHFADQSARDQPHPIWLVEGLASLFESATAVDDRLVPRHSARLRSVQMALRRGRIVPWRDLMQMEQPAFMRVADVGYAQARYMLFYMWEKGHLKRFYDEYTRGAAYQGDRSALESFEVVFGKPIDEVQRDWEAWLVEQEVPPIPFIGIATQPARGGLEITTVVEDTAAERAKLAVNDVILSVDGSPMRTSDDLLEVLSTREVRDVIDMELRRGEETMHVKITLGER